MKAAVKPTCQAIEKQPSSTPLPLRRENSASTEEPTAYSTPTANPSASRIATSCQTSCTKIWSTDKTMNAARFQPKTGRRPDEHADQRAGGDQALADRRKLQL